MGSRPAARRGLNAYTNHNLDTSREYYPEVRRQRGSHRTSRGFHWQVIILRTYDNRLDTIIAVREAGSSVCSGGILGLGESNKDRVGLIWEMSK